MKKYFYDGPVMEFGRLVENRWQGETMAVSKTKALGNLSYQWKKQNGRSPNAKVTLPGKLQAIH